MIIHNNTKAVKVLKAVGVPPLRLFPGHNTVDESTIQIYFKDNPAAEGLRKDCLTVVNAEGLSTEELTIADRAKQRNDDLNKAQKVIKANQKTIRKGEKANAKQAAQLEEQAVQIAEQTAQIEEQGKMLLKLSKQIDDMTKPKK